jgi:hypothetical protein
MFPYCSRQHKSVFFKKFLAIWVNPSCRLSCRRKPFYFVSVVDWASWSSADTFLICRYRNKQGATTTPWYLVLEIGVLLFYRSVHRSRAPVLSA